MTNKDWFNQQMFKRTLDAAIKAMSRNRALLMTLNLLSAIILMTIYLERASFDTMQREAYLIALDNIRKELKKTGVPDSLANSADPQLIERWYMQDNHSRDTTEPLSFQLYRLRVLRNDLEQVALPPTQNLVLGISAPRNDLVPIVGIAMVCLYAWLLFSFRQLADIISQFRRFFVPESSDTNIVVGSAATTNSSNEDMLKELVEMHFLFRTSRKGPTRWFVRLLYFSPPIVIFLALLNDLLSLTERGGDWHALLVRVSSGRFIIGFACLVVLLFIAYFIWEADRSVNVEALSSQPYQR